jgi:cell wall-associated NlpC family hydrolase
MDAKEQEQRMAVIKEARSWLHTPFRHQARIKGPRGGVDCGQILACVYENAGVRPPIVTEPYGMQWALHQYREMYVEEMLKYTREIEECAAQPADIVVYKVAHTYSHGAIIIDPWPGTILHAVTGFGVVYADASREGYLRSVTKKAGAIPCRFFSPWG